MFEKKSRVRCICLQREEVFKIGFAYFSACSFVFNVSSLGLKQLSEFFIDLHHSSLVILMIVFVSKKQNTSRLDPL